MMEPCLGWSMMFIGMNWDVKGMTLSSAPTAMYAATTSGMGCPFSRHRGNLNTGVPSFSAATAEKKSDTDHRGVHRPLGLIGTTHTERGLTQRVGFSIDVGDGEDAHHPVTLLPQAAVHLLAEQTAANYGQFELILVIWLEGEDETHVPQAVCSVNGTVQ